MPTLTIALGVCLSILGFAGYLGGGRTSLTALIPAAFGLVFLILGAAAFRPPLRKHVMHAAAALALIGFLATVRAVGKMPALLSGGPVERPLAVVAQSIMALLCAVFVALCVKSLIDARRRRAKESP